MAFLKRKNTVVSTVVTELKETPAVPESVGNEPHLVQLAQELVAAELALGAGASVMRLVSLLLDHALSLGASDIHLDPHPSLLKVRFRVDGVMREAWDVPKVLAGEIVSRLKILAQLRTDEHQAAQDGRFRIGEGGKVVDVRVSVVPTYYGENAVLRLLADRDEAFTLDALGFSAANKQTMLRAIKRPHGMVLVTGPTGSGKTTTLYTLIRMLQTPEVSIITIEDPIEYAISGVVQIQVNSRTGLTFASGLRSMLRQDPNIMMVGEIRDHETAGIAVNTALTGHLVLSTLHTSDAATTLPRLLDMKIESYLIASTVNVVVGQRLVRKICQNCKIAKNLNEAEVASLTTAMPGVSIGPEAKQYCGRGCESCLGTGFSGRIGLHEILVPDEQMRDAILRRASSAELRALAVDAGMISLIEDGWEKVRAGLTTAEEVLRVLYE